MASDVVAVSIPASFVHGSQAPKPVTPISSSGNAFPPGGSRPVAVVDTRIALPEQAAVAAGSPQSAAAIALVRPPPANNPTKLSALVGQLNKYLNDSGRPDQFRVDPASQGKTIQEINPATGEVIGEFSASQFPELARSLGVSGVLVDSRA